MNLFAVYDLFIDEFLWCFVNAATEIWFLVMEYDLFFAIGANSVSDSVLIIYLINYIPNSLSDKSVLGIILFKIFYFTIPLFLSKFKILKFFVIY